MQVNVYTNQYVGFYYTDLLRAYIKDKYNLTNCIEKRTSSKVLIFNIIHVCLDTIKFNCVIHIQLL